MNVALRWFFAGWMALAGFTALPELRAGDCGCEAQPVCCHKAHCAKKVYCCPTGGAAPAKATSQRGQPSAAPQMIPVVDTAPVFFAPMMYAPVMPQLATFHQAAPQSSPTRDACSQRLDELENRVNALSRDILTLNDTVRMQNERLDMILHRLNNPRPAANP